MERFFDAMNQEISQIQGEKGQIRKKTRRKECRKEKQEILFLKRMWRFPYSCVLHRLGTPSCNPPSGEHTCVGTSLTTEDPADQSTGTSKSNFQ